MGWLSFCCLTGGCVADHDLSNNAMISRHAPHRIVLVGMPGSGKTAVARLLARRLGKPWRYADTDDLIVALDGRSIPQIFRDSGEAGFRQIERQAIAQYERSEHTVVATGGGAVLEPVNRRRLWQRALVVYLKARPETLAGRVAGPGAKGVTSRPLLASGDAVARLRELAGQRSAVYELADWTIQTDALFPDQVADEIVRVQHKLAEQLTARPGRDAVWQERPHAASETLATRVQTPTGTYAVHVGDGLLERVGRLMSETDLRGRATIVADAAVAGIYGEQALASLRDAGFDAEMTTIPGGEQHKHTATVNAVYDRLIDRKAERGDPIVALGGGVTTDLAGFVAATYLRGVPLVHVPTSLLGMVDAAIGGKVGVDHPRGKNLIGAFYQPRLVVADTNMLRTLPPRELTAGWAEVIKHGLIMDLPLVHTLQRDSEQLLALEPSAVVPVLRRSAQLKAEVVSADERESGVRLTLNYGHTIGHGIEAATEYSAVLHGEAVAVGMQGAAAIAVEIGLLNADAAEQQRTLLELYHLPLSWPGVEPEAVRQAMSLDKKVAARKQRWVLLSDIGRTVIRDDVPTALVDRVLRNLLRR